MKQFLENQLWKIHKMDSTRPYCHVQYSEDRNPDALSDDWLENHTSYVYKTAVLLVSDSNKFDWAYILMATQRGKDSEPEFIGSLHFQRGENDDIARVIQRMIRQLALLHPVFDQLLDMEQTLISYGPDPY